MVVDALDKDDPRSLPFLGNVPIVREHGESNDRAIVLALLREIARVHLFHKRYQRECWDFTPFPPDTHTVAVLAAACRREELRIIYPDPPLPPGELARACPASAPRPAAVTPRPAVERAPPW